MVPTPSISLEQPPGADPASGECAWCRAPFDSSSTRLHGRIRCARCGVATTAPWPTDAELDEAYAGWYRPEGGRFGPLDAVLRRTRGRLAGRIDAIAPPGRVLDVGAGDGALLDALSARGRDALGLERESHRPDVRAAHIGEVDGGWAAIVFWHSLEHMRDPGTQLACAADLLAPGGTLVVAVPNTGSVQAELFGDRWLALDLPRHLVHIPAAALVRRLQELGLSIDRVSHWRGGQALFGWMHGLVGWLSPERDLYDAIRQREAQRRPLRGSERLGTLALGAALAPVAAIGAAGEVALRRGGSIYVEARRD